MNNNISKYEHIFFDLDHTIWDFETNSKETIKDLYTVHLLQEKGVKNFDDFFNVYSVHNHNLWDKYTKGFIKQDELKWKRMWLTLVDFKIVDEKLAHQLSGEYTDLLPNKKNLFEYTIEILSYLKAQNYQLHLITNGFESIQYKKLKSSNLDVFFTEVITSEGSNSLKPNKEIFDYALLKAKATTFNSIMIGDNLDADIDGGRNAGLDTIYVNHLNRKKYKNATHTIFHLQELERIL